MRWVELGPGDVAHSAAEAFLLLQAGRLQLWLNLDTGQTFEVQGTTAEVAVWWRIERRRG